MIYVEYRIWEYISTSVVAGTLIGGPEYFIIQIANEHLSIPGYSKPGGALKGTSFCGVAVLVGAL